MSLNIRSTLLCGTAVAALLAVEPQDARAQMYSSGPGVYLSGEGRYLMNDGSRVPSFSDDEFPGAVTPVVKPRASEGWGGKVMLGYRFNNNWDLGVGGSAGWLDGKKSDGAASVLGATTSFGAGETKVKLEYYVADFEAGYNWKLGGVSNLRVFGGIRYADFSQRANSASVGVAITTAGTSTTFYSAKRKTTYWGVGPRAGINGQFGLGQSGFHVFGGVAGAVLFGKHKEKQDAASANLASTSSWRSSRSKSKVVTNAEGEIGLGYQFGGGGGGTTVSLQAGYRGEAFWGAGSKSPVYTETGVTGDRGDYLMHGPFVRLTATFGAARPVMAAAPPPPPPPPMAPRKNYLVFFDFDRSNITADAQRVIEEAAAAATAGGSTRLQLTGHTDRSGSDQYNMALSLRRGEAVKQALIRLGIPSERIVVIGRGEIQPLVPTADGVREPQNRRVEIMI